MGGEKYTLTGNEIKILKEADKTGEKGIIWFRDFGIRLSFISSIYLATREVKSALTASENILNIYGQEFERVEENGRLFYRKRA